CDGHYYKWSSGYDRFNASMSLTGTRGRHLDEWRAYPLE
ncbi:MAG: hypothetical protein JWO80_627, partial [Bryobacterales bacterium]|nr:hypothetical protein [Bryobacterales bacterium]